MTRTLLAIAMALFAATTLFAPGAEACISCEYVPPVVNTPVKSYGAAHYRKRPTHTAAKKRRIRKAERRIVEREIRAVERAAADAIAETTAATKPAVSTNSSIAVAKAVVGEDEGAEPVKSTAHTARKPEASLKVDCKKFFPSVGMTLTVPCE